MNPVFRFIWRVLRPILHVVYPLQVTGMENLPEHGAILCANHSHFIDVVMVALTTPIDYHLRVMAKEELFKNPILNWLFRKVGGFPVSRGNADIQAIKTAIKAMKDGENMLVFPEGTRVKAEGEVQAKSGVAMIAARTGAVLVPVYVEVNKRLFRKNRLIFGKPVTPVYSGRHGTAEEMQQIADDILKQAYDLGRDA